MTTLPLPSAGAFNLAVSAPGAGPHFWAGAPSAIELEDGSFAMAYRVRRGYGVDEVVLATSPDGVEFTTIVTLSSGLRGAAMTERPSLLRLASGRWRLYICDLPQGAEAWSVLAAEADQLVDFADAEFAVVFAGDDRYTVKDPVVTFDGYQWQAWFCLHLRDTPGEDDRMVTGISSSLDGWKWSEPTVVLRGEPDTWNQRGARMTGFLPDGRITFDGRANKEENWFERTGIAEPVGDGTYRPVGEAVSSARYLNVLPLRNGDFRIFYEQVLEDESHELRTEYVSSGVNN